MVQAVAIGLLLGLHHKAAESVGVHELLLPVGEDHGLKAVAGIDIADDLGGILELALDQSDPLCIIGGGPDRCIHDHALIEGGSGLRQGHGVTLVQGAVIPDALVVESMAQLMGQGHHIGEHTVKIGQNTALADGADAGAESAAPLAVPGIEVDPGIVKGPGHHSSQLFVKSGELLDQVFLGILGGKGGGRFAHGRKQIVPGQAILVAQSLCLGLQVLPELGQVLVHGAQHGLQGLPLHVGIEQSPVQRRLITPELALGDGLQLDGVQRMGHRLLDGFIAGDLRLVGILTDLGIRIVGQVPDGRQIGGRAPIGNGHGAGQIALELAPGAAAGHTHFCHDRFGFAAHLIAGGIHLAGKIEFIILQILVAPDQLHQIGQLDHPGIEGSAGGGHSAADGHDPAHVGTGLRVLGIGSGTQIGVAEELAQICQLFQQLYTPAQAGNRLHIG